MARAELLKVRSKLAPFKCGFFSLTVLAPSLQGEKCSSKRGCFECSAWTGYRLGCLTGVIDLN